MVHCGRGCKIVWLVTVCVVILVQSAVAATATATIRLDNRYNKKASNGLDGRIINGTEASLNNTKHQVSIRRRSYDGYFFGSGHLCGGSLIEQNVVLTAAHCFLNQDLWNGTYRPATDFIIVMGTLNRYNRTQYTLTFDIVKLVVGIDIFNISTYENDIAVVFLNDSVPLDYPTVEKIERARIVPTTGTICQVTGWGETEKGYNSNDLMTVDLPLIDYEVCANDTDLTGLVRAGMLCAGYEKGEKDACVGDSGGPLVCDRQLTGIVSWGVSCAKPRLPGVYTNVAYWGDWIDQVLGNYTSPGGGNNTNNGNNTGNGNKTDNESGGNSTSDDSTGGGAAIVAFNFSHSTVMFLLLAVWTAIMSKF